MTQNIKSHSKTNSKNKIFIKKNKNQNFINIIINPSKMKHYIYKTPIRKYQPHFLQNL